MSATETAREILRLADEATPGRWLMQGQSVVAEIEHPRGLTTPIVWAKDQSDTEYIAAANPSATSDLARAYLELLAENERLRENVETCESYASGLEDELEDLQGRDGEVGDDS